MKRGILFVALLSVFLVSKAQNGDIKIKGAKGEWSISNITPEQAYDKALIEAKFDALRLAGIDESINAINSLFSTNEGTDYKGISSIELGGEVIDFTIVEKKIDQEQHSSALIAKVTIDAVVRKYTKKRDTSFQVKVESVERSYKEGDRLTFSITPSKDGYLKIFYFEDDNTGSLLYPNEYEQDILFEGKKSVKFPLSKGFDYELAKTDNTKPFENNLLIFIFTKKNIPFYEDDVNYHSVLNWMAKINPDERVEVRNLFQITKTRTRSGSNSK
jgi:hypothetical protein